MITVHRFRQGGLFLAVDGGSAAVHQLDEVAYELLGVWQAVQAGLHPVELEELWQWWVERNFADATQPDSIWSKIHGELLQRWGPAAVWEAGEELLSLVQEGLLFADDSYLDELDGDFIPGPGSVKALCLNVSHDCNLRCRYCFAGTGNFGGERLSMPRSVARAAIDFLLENSEGRQRLEVDFFGGEPLLNLPVVKDTVRYAKEQAAARGKEIRFTITTNGVLLDAKTAAYLNDTMFNIILSLDGRPEVNDRMRLAPGGRSTYREVLPRFLHMAHLRGNRLYYVRGTYTAYNIDFFQDVRHLVEAGFDRVSVEPVVAEPDRDYALREEHLPRLFDQYDQLAEYYCDLYHTPQRFEFYHFNLDVLKGQCLAKRLTGCGAGREYLAITPTGDIYPCHQFVGRESYKMGNILEGFLNPDIRAAFQAAYVLNKSECRSCWARFFCGGGCHANAEAASGNILQPDSFSCRLLRKRLECSIYIQARLAEEVAENLLS